MIYQKNSIKKNTKFLKYLILAIFIALQSTDLLHDHHDHDHDHDEGDYCVACHASNVDQDIVLAPSDFIIDFVVVITATLIAIFIKNNKLTLYQLPRSPPLP
mgnify:CR=1 FL=1|tara:strand:+ start:224 stop:529 length:306 start_codon:yes stop_codon:yes gene_type:complete